MIVEENESVVIGLGKITLLISPFILVAFFIQQPIVYLGLLGLYYMFTVVLYVILYFVVN